tara:strand:+ start:45 stop:1004 length:960 start_codon:yes stop_codon:yes gene_type:complete
MKKNLGLIGFGNIGSKLYYEIINKNIINRIYILKKRSIPKKENKNIFTDKKKFFLKKIKLFVVASPTKTHFHYLKKIINKKKALLIEKPLVSNKNDLKKLIKLNENIKSPVVVNYIDLFNPGFKAFKKNICKIGKIKKITVKFGKYQKIYKSNRIDAKNMQKLPFFDWMPHPIAILVKLFGYPKDIKLVKNKFFKIKNYIFQDLKLKFIYKNFDANILFSNKQKKSNRDIVIKSNKNYIIYSGQSKKILNSSISYSKASFKKFDINKNLIFKTSGAQNNLYYTIDNFIKKSYSKKNNLKFDIQVMTILFKIGSLIFTKK